MDVIKSLIEEVFNPLTKTYSSKLYADTSFHKIFGIYKIALLPLKKSEESYNRELKKLLKIYSNEKLILDQQTKNFFGDFLFLYIRWLRKTDKNKLTRLVKLLEIEEFLKNNELNEKIKKELKIAYFESLIISEIAKARERK